MRILHACSVKLFDYMCTCHMHAYTFTNSEDVYYSRNQSGKGTWIDIGIDGDIWCVDQDGAIYHYFQEQGMWGQIAGMLKRMCVCVKVYVCVYEDKYLHGDSSRYLNCTRVLCWKLRSCSQVVPGEASLFHMYACSIL